MNKENIKMALDAFEEDNFISAKEIITKEIKDAKDEYLSKELNMTYVSKDNVASTADASDSE